MKQLIPTLALFVFVLGQAASAADDIGQDIRVPYEKFVLKNGLTLLVHEDHKAPIVAVNVWYHVGSKNEKEGKTGFAHLFEHLMFNGSEHFDDDYFKAMEKVGATDLNGTTSEDRTNYFQNAPKDALDLLLWMESDRMGHLLGAVTQAKLDEQRGVVQNEKRQSENQPYGIARELITKGTYLPGHPYSWTVIGSMEDLNAASLEDVKEWFRTYYGAANATIVVAGDVDPQVVREKVEKYFGAIPPGPPVIKQKTWIAKRSGSHRQIAQDRVPQSRIYKVWNVPEFGDRETEYLNLVSDVLSSGKSSRLYKRLVYDEQIASDVSAFIRPSEIGGQFFIVATARPGQSLEKVEKAIDEELARFLKDGPTSAELERVKTQLLAGFIRGIERIGGFGGKSDILARNEVFMDDPDYYKTMLQTVRQATAGQLKSAALNWLSDGVYILEIHPFPPHDTIASDVDRSRLPTPKIEPDVRFPDLQRAELSNGLQVVLAERHSVPMVKVTLLANAGYAADSFASPGVAKLAMDMLDEGTQSRSALEIDEELARLGAQFGAGSDLDSSSVTISALNAKLDPSLDLFADIILNPAFPETDFERLKKQQLDAIKREKSQPATMGLRVLPRLLYGDDHPYNIPFTGSGTEHSVQGLSRADVQKFYQTWFKPNNAVLIVVGDTTMEAIKPKLEQRFSKWKAGKVPEKDIQQAKTAGRSTLYLIDRPGSIQSIVFAGQLAPPKANPDEIAIETMNHILGGTFTSRINMNLREDKHWSYGARSTLVPARGPRPFIVTAPVQTDKTKESVIEVEKELRGITGDQPVTKDELSKAQVSQTLRLPGSWETINRVADTVAELIQFGLPPNYYDTYAENVLALNVENVSKAASRVVNPDQLVWVVVGDRSKIEPGLRELGFADIRLIDTEGKPVE